LSNFCNSNKIRIETESIKADGYTMPM